MDTPIWVIVGWLVIFGLRITGLVGAISGVEMFIAGILFLGMLALLTGKVLSK